MNNFKKRLTTDLTISLLIILALFAGVLFFMSKAGDYSDQIISERTLLADRTESVSHLASLRDQYAQASNYLNVLYNIIPSYDQLINLNQDIQSLAAKEKLDYGFSFAGETPKPQGGLGSVAFSLAVTSDSYASLMDFIDDLQNFRYLNSIDNVSLKNNNNRLTMSVQGRVFYR